MAVKKIIGTSELSRISRQTEKPSKSGKIMSRITKSGLYFSLTNVDNTVS